MKTKKLVSLALFTTLALILSLVEASLPPLAPIPGIKLGLANIITLILLLNYTPSDTFFVLIARILLASLFAGQTMSLLYSLSGGIFCFVSMWAANKLLKQHYIFLTSMIGSCFHNIGQISIAILITRTFGVISYLPLLLVSGILTGLFTGLCAYYSQRYLKPLLAKNNRD